MNKEQFIFWIKGFAKAVNEEGPTPKQWETIVSELGKVGEPVLYPTYTPNTAPIQTLPFIQPADPHNPYKVTCGTDVTLTATSGSGNTYSISGVITTNNTTTTLPKGTNVSYTANLPKELLND